MNHLEHFKNIEAFIFDVDGVLTDGQVLVQEDGALLRTMNTRDGYAMQLAASLGYHIAIITGGNSPGVERRLLNLGIDKVYMRTMNKIEAYDNFIQTYEIDESKILYMGDDMPDIPPMRRVGLPCSPADAVAEVAAVARYISPFVGGAGCVRDVIEKVLKLNQEWK